MHDGYFLAFSLVFLPFPALSPSPAYMHVRMMDQTPSPLSRMSGQPYSRYRFAGCPTNSTIVPSPPPPNPLALSTLYPGRSAAEAGSFFVFCVYIPGDQLVVVYFC